MKKLLRFCFFETNTSVSDFYGSLYREGREKKIQNNCCSNIDKEFKEILLEIHPEVLMMHFGCGSPIPPFVSSLNVLDLGSGAGKDCFILSKLCGENGSVVGIDMTDDAIDFSKKYIDYHMHQFEYEEPNVSFYQGDICDIPLEDESIDLITSNCVVNLTDDKRKVLSEVFRILRDGGEFFFSDIYSSEEVPKTLKNNDLLRGECVSGSLWIEDFDRVAKESGFDGFFVVNGREVVFAEEIEEVLKEEWKENGEVPPYYSLTLRLIKQKKKTTQKEGISYNVVFEGEEDDAVSEMIWDASTILKKGEEISVSERKGRLMNHSRYPITILSENDYSIQEKTPKELLDEGLFD